METIIDVLHFLNKLLFVGYLENDDYENFKCIKKVLTDEFQDVNSEKLLYMLGIVDDLRVSFITPTSQHIPSLTNGLREDIFSLVKLSIN